MTGKDYMEIVNACKKDYSEACGCETQNPKPTRAWIRAWMQSNYHMVKIPSYFYRMFS